MVLLPLLVAVAPARAGGEDQAEYRRLSDDMDRLAERNAWAGVERTYRAIEALQVPMTFQDHVNGAHAARALGDVGSARARLKLASEMQEDREILDWLWDIDSNYGQVAIHVDPGTVDLRPEAMPFEPDRAAAVAFAQQEVARGAFEGFLPGGTYYVGEVDLDVRPRVQAARLDLRSGEEDAPRRAGRAPRPDHADPAPEPAEADPIAPAPGPAREKPEQPTFSLLLGAMGPFEWGAGLVVRPAAPRARVGMVGGFGVDPVTGVITGSGELRGLFGPVYVDLRYGPLVWTDLKQAFYGPSLGLGFDSAPLGLTLADGAVSFDANLGYGYAPGSVDTRWAPQIGVAVSLNFGP
jgi:hypothetical protein